MRPIVPWRLMPIVLAALLAGCGDSMDLTNASIEEVASAAASVSKPETGQWTTDATLVSFDPGPERSPMADAMAAQVGETTGTDACLSPDDAAKPLFGDLTPTAGADCTFRRFTLRDGKLDATMTCRNRDGALLEVTQRGKYSATAVDLTAVVARRGADGKPAGGMTTHVVAKRTGECAVK
jgi:hypothetical protein